LSFHTETTLAGYARAAVDLRIRMAEVAQTMTGQAYVRELLAGRLKAPPVDDDQAEADERVVDAVSRAVKTSWAYGDSFVLAPAMTAIVAAAAEALDLTGDLLTAESAPCDTGVLFLPEPIHHRRPTGTVAAVGALTWTRATAHSGEQFWLICSYSPLHDPDDPNAADVRRTLAAAPHVRAELGPYLLNDFDYLPIARPVPAAPNTPHVDDADLGWQSAPDGRYVIADDGMRTQVATAILYAFWRIQAQPITIAAKPPLDRAARRRATRASLVHDTRVVMLRRTSPITEPSDGEAKWHYRVRFIVKGHWRRLHDKDGQPYRIWINAHIKGPDGAPLLHGEKVAVLAR
jgi:hypothetical protein